ncbi:tyrosine-type recombinase/integrase [Streptomyces clavifer]|nr:tyrosine-type recombinase/integrase [Streptomyces clavifer]
MSRDCSAASPRLHHVLQPTTHPGSHPVRLRSTHRGAVVVQGVKVEREPRNVYRSFTRVAESAGLRVIRLHDARHGCATILTAAGVAPRVVMETLGHSEISITMDVYTHVVQDAQREAISHMDRLLMRRPGREWPPPLMSGVDVKDPGP